MLLTLTLTLVLLMPLLLLTVVPHQPAMSPSRTPRSPFTAPSSPPHCPPPQHTHIRPLPRPHLTRASTSIAPPRTAAPLQRRLTWCTLVASPMTSLCWSRSSADQLPPTPAHHPQALVTAALPFPAAVGTHSCAHVRCGAPRLSDVPNLNSVAAGQQHIGEAAAVM